MRRMVIALAVLVSACASTQPLGELDHAATLETPVLLDLPPAGVPVVDNRPRWEGFAATQPGSESLVAYVMDGDVAVYEGRDDPAPFRTLEETTILGTQTVLGVVTPPIDGWVEVMLPGRPNGSTGWVRTPGLSFYIADSEIHIDLEQRTLRYLVDGVEILSTEVGVGSRFNQTPTGHFFVTDSVTLANPNSPWGPHALGLSARSETITEFNGGDGIIGIHGTNNPSSIGGAISLGCVRLPNEMITILHDLVPIGTRVTIEA